LRGGRARQARRRIPELTYLVLLVEADEAEVESGKDGVDEQRDDLVGRAEVRGGVVFGVGGEGVGHAREDALPGEGVAAHCGDGGRCRGS